MTHHSPGPAPSGAGHSSSPALAGPPQAAPGLPLHLDRRHPLGLDGLDRAEILALLDAGGQMHEGPTATHLGLRGLPDAAESVVAAR